MKISATRILIFSILLMLAPLSYSFLSFRSMMSEGAHWYFTILDYHVYFSHPFFYRYVDFFIQYPALFFLRNFAGDFSANTVNSIASHLLSFSWTFHPIVSLYITYRILRSHSRKDLFVFPVVGFLSAFMPASAYAVALALPAMSVFWPVFFCILFANGKSIKDYIITTLLLVGLTFCYEPTIVFFILFILMAFADILWLKAKSKKYNFYLILLCLASIAFLLYVISTVPDQNTGPFWTSLWYGDWTTRLMGIVVTFSISIILLFNFVVRRFKTVSNILALAIFFAGTFYFSVRLSSVYSMREYEGALGWAYDARSSALPMTWCVAALCWLFCCFQGDETWLQTKVSRLVAVLVLVAAFATAYMDFRQTEEWNFYFNRYRQFVSQSKGCVHLRYADFIKVNKPPSVEAYAAAYSAVMSQVLKGDAAPIRTLIFVKDGIFDPKQSKAACPERKDKNFYQTEWGYEMVLNSGRLVFSEEDFPND